MVFFILDDSPISLFPELNTTSQALALAWVARNPNTSTVILGVSDVDQLRENLQALQVLPKLTPEIMDKIEAILDNKPQPPVSALIESQSLFNISFKVNHGRPSLDPLGREGLYVWIEVWRKVSARGLWTLSNTWTHTLLYLLILGLKWGLIPKKYIGDKAVGALREREREREKSSFPIYGQGREVSWIFGLTSSDT